MATHAETVALPPGERALLLGALATVAALSWLYLGHHSMPPGMADFAMLSLMWVVMMLAMMLPSVAPAVLLHAAVSRRVSPAKAAVRNLGFIAGYAGAWTAFALAAAAAQLGLGWLALLSEDMRAASPVLGAALLAAAGLWQLTPAKDVCLSKCRMPLQFIAENWREGARGALRMGLQHGFYCIGCCGVLMCLLFVGGVMNLLWVALLAAFVLLEKISLPGSRAGRWISGGGLLVSAGVLLA